MNKIVGNHTDRNSWIRVYDDGWMEQGGKVAASFSSRGSVSFEFPKAFTSTPLSIDTTVICPYESDNNGFELLITSISATGCTLLFDNTTGYSKIKGFYWRAKGY